MSKHLKYILGVGLGVLLMVLFLRNTDWKAFWSALRSARPGYVAAAVALTVLSYVLRAIRWHYLVRPIQRPRFGPLFEGICVGFTVSNLLPGKLGEVVRPYILSTRDKIKMSSLMATVAIDRILDGLAIVVLLVFYLLFGLASTRTPELEKYIPAMRAAGGVFFGLMAAAAAFVSFLRFKTEPTLRIARVLLRPLPERLGHRLIDTISHFAAGLSVLSDAGSLAWAALWSIVVWVEIAVAHYFMIRAFDIHLRFVAMFFLLFLMAAGVSVPTPGGMGGLQWASKLGLQLTSPATPDGVLDATAMAVWGNSILPVTAIGLVYLWKEGLSLRKIESIEGSEALPEAK